jgi:hypothetical protein
VGAVPQSAHERGDRARLGRLAAQASSSGRKISPMQLAAQILEDALTGLLDEHRP